MIGTRYIYKEKSCKLIFLQIDVLQVTVWVGKSQKRRCYPYQWQWMKKVCTHSLTSFLPSFHISILPFFLAFLPALLLTVEKPTSVELNKMWVKMYCRVHFIYCLFVCFFFSHWKGHLICPPVIKNQAPVLVWSLGYVSGSSRWLLAWL